LASTISNNRNEAERSPGRIAATLDPDYFLEKFVNPSRICRILDLTILIEEASETFEKFPSQKVLIKPSLRKTGSKL